MAAELGGLNHSSYELLQAAAARKAASEPWVAGKQQGAWRARWITMLSVAIQDRVAATLAAGGARLLDAATGSPPASADVWLDGE